MLRATEIKAGETLNRDYFKHLRNFPPQSNAQPVKRFLIYAGHEEYSTEDIQIVPYQKFTAWVSVF